MSRLILGTATFITLGGMAPEIVQAFPVILADELDRNHVESARMGLEALNNENYSLAFSLFNTSLLVNPDYAEAYAGRASARARLGDRYGAISDLEQAAGLFQKQGYFTEAISSYDAAISLDPDYVIAYAGRASARARLGDRSGTISDLEQAARLFQERGNTAAYNQVQEALQQIR
ncbi:MAG: tetratricopeptide repeat protein [Sodalinema sp.]|uniref:tetratricopeptide repeat protein n=1 Tax=Sodalinema sp. TaxID=3080550 RepID=UPI00396F2A01